MNQNLTYVAMTRHREDVQVYGSKCDFWREEKVGDILSKSGEKLGAADYLDARSLSLLMKDEDKFLDKLFTRLGDELHAMGVVSKKAFTIVVDHFLGRSSERSDSREIRLKPGTVREEVRAQEILRKAPEQEVGLKPEGLEAISGLWKSLAQYKERVNYTVQDVHEDWKHPAFKSADHYKHVFTEGLKLYGEEGAVKYWQSSRAPFFTLYEQKLKSVEKELISPFLSYMSDESRDLARKAAFEDPDKALQFLGRVQASKKAEQEERIKAAQLLKPSLKESFKGSSLKDISLLKEPSLSLEERNKAFSSYMRFKELRRELKKDPDDRDYRKEIKKISDYFLKDKEAFEHIKTLDPDIEKAIMKVAQEKVRSYGRGYGGMSL